MPDRDRSAQGGPGRSAPGGSGRSAPGGSGRSAPGIQDLLSIGAVCGVMIGLGVFLGYLLDGVAGTRPLLTFVGLAFGILAAATGSYYVIRPYLASSGRGAPEK